jgi:hypothetical protein
VPPVPVPLPSPQVGMRVPKFGALQSWKASVMASIGQKGSLHHSRSKPIVESRSLMPDMGAPIYLEGDGGCLRGCASGRYGPDELGLHPPRF